MTTLSIPALKILVAADPWGARVRLAEALVRVREESGALAEKRLFEAVIESLDPETKYELREYFEGRSLFGGENRRLVWSLRRACREADRTRLTTDQIRGYLSQEEFDRCIQEGCVRPSDRGRWEVNDRLLA